MAMQQPKKVEAEKAALVGLLLLADLTFSGVIFGWSPLLLMLQKEGQFSERCQPGVISCVEQSNAFNMIFTLGAFAVNMVALPEGLFLDRVGPQVGREATDMPCLLENRFVLLIGG